VQNCFSIPYLVKYMKIIVRILFAFFSNNWFSLKTILHVSIGMLFEIVMSLMYELYQSKLVTNKKATMQNCFSIPYFVKYMKIIVRILFAFFSNNWFSMVTFCYVYHCYSTYRGLRLVDKHMETILDTCEESIFRI